MATKATAGRKAALFIGTTGDATVTPFSAVRNWTMRVERQVIDGTNNDSSGWRELVAEPQSASSDEYRDTGQRTWVFSAEAIYDVSTGGPNDSQPAQRAGILGALIGGGNVWYLEVRLGRDPTSTSGFGWAQFAKNAGISGKAGFVESVEVGGSYDAPVLYNIVVRGTGNLSDI